MAEKHKAHHKETKPATERFRFTLEASDFHHYRKNNYWYIGIGLLLVLSLVLAFYFKNYLLSLVTVAFGLALFRLAGLEPGSRKVVVDENGVTWGDTFVPYHQAKAFWVSSSHDQANVYIERLNLSSTLHFVIPGNQADQLVSFLSVFLPWHEHKGEPLPDMVNRLLRF